MKYICKIFPFDILRGKYLHETYVFFRALPGPGGPPMPELVGLFSLPSDFEVPRHSRIGVHLNPVGIIM